MLMSRDNRQQALKALDSIERQALFARVQATNDTAYKVREALQVGMMTAFDRVTPFIHRSIWVRQATREKPEAEVYPRDNGGKTVDPVNIIRPQAIGGPRRLKRSEIALQRVGILPRGSYLTPGPDAPRDAYGNVPGSLIVQILTYFQAVGEQGYKANMTDKRKASLARKGRTADGYATVRGVQYFVAYGRMRGGARRTAKGDFDERAQHLPAGIYARSGIHGSSVRAIFWFARRPTYKPRLAYEDIGTRAAHDAFPAAFQARLSAALRTAR